MFRFYDFPVISHLPIDTLGIFFYYVSMNLRPALTVVFLMVALAMLMVVSPSTTAQAQDETSTPTPTATPTVTPTPADQYRVTLGSGAELVVERRITYGDIAIVLLLLVMLVGASLYGIIRLIRLWLF